MQNRIRVTTHSARDAVTSKHNDRNFDVSKSDHIDSTRSVNNRYWVFNQGEIAGTTNGQTFEDAEKEFYEETFAEGLEARNKRYVNKGKSKCTRNMEQYRSAKHSRPEETILMIGDMHTDISPDLVWDIVLEQLDWRSKMFPQLVTLDVALHADEQGGIHVHERSVWVGHDKFGYPVVGQNKALNEMEIERPDMSREESRYNNSKITYSKTCREHFVEICEAHGILVEKNPREASKAGKKLLQFQVDSIRADLEELKLERAKLQEELANKNELLEKTLEAKIQAAEIKRKFGDKETKTYWKSNLDQAEDIARNAREDREAAERYYSWAIEERRKTEKLKAEAEEGFALRDENMAKKKKLDKYIGKKAKEIAAQKINEALEKMKSNNYTKAMIDYMSQFASLEGRGSLYDDFDVAYIKSLDAEYESGVKVEKEDIEESTDIENDDIDL